MLSQYLYLPTFVNPSNEPFFNFSRLLHLQCEFEYFSCTLHRTAGCHPLPSFRRFLPERRVSKFITYVYLIYITFSFTLTYLDHLRPGAGFFNRPSALSRVTLEFFCMDLVLSFRGSSPGKLLFSYVLKNAF